MPGRSGATAGRVSIPQAIRERAGFHPGCELSFRLIGEQVVLEKVDSFVLLDVITGDPNWGGDVGDGRMRSVGAK